MKERTNRLGVLCAAVLLIFLTAANCWRIQRPSPVYRVYKGYPYKGYHSEIAYAAYCSQILEEHPTDWKLIAERGKAYAKSGYCQLAIRDFNQALKLAPQASAIILYRARVEFWIGDLKRSLADYNCLINEGAGTATLFASRSRVLSSLHNYKNAMADAVHAVKLQPAFAPAYIASAYAALGLGQYPTVVADCQHAQQLSPEWATKHAMLCLARMYILQGRWQGCISYCHKVLRQTPYNSNALWLQALALCGLGKFKQATIVATRSICVDPMVPAPYIVRAQARYHLQQYPDARLDASRAIQLSPLLANKPVDVYVLAPKAILQNDLQRFPDLTFASSTAAK